VLAGVAAQNTGPLDQQSVTDIFAGIIRETRRLGTQRMEEQSGKAVVGMQRPPTNG